MKIAIGIILVVFIIYIVFYAPMGGSKKEIEQKKKDWE